MHEETCAMAAKIGHLEMLKWARAKECSWDEETCAMAAKNGHLEMLKWARAQECPWDKRTCEYAAKNGHLEMLKWARGRAGRRGGSPQVGECPWDKRTCEAAAANGHLDVLKWARANGCPWCWLTCVQEFVDDLSPRTEPSYFPEVREWVEGKCPGEEDLV